MNNRMPSPPYPAPDSARLAFIVEQAKEALASGEVNTEGAIIHAAVTGWYEGHIDGEDHCQGCDHRGALGHVVSREQWTRDHWSPELQ